MKYFIFILLLSFQNNAMATDFEQVSQDFLYAVRVGDNYTIFQNQLSLVSQKDLVNSLNTEDKKKAFWLNVYNAFIQIKAKENPQMIVESKNDFFSNKWIIIAQKDISFDDIEHGILRRSNWKYGMGYFTKWFVSSYEKTFRLETLDFRIHFALNCGAKGCPPIAFYNSEKLEEQLETATAGFLSLNSVFNEAENLVEVSKILSWFKGDFGGASGIQSLLKKHEIITQSSNPKITFKPYDWSLSLSNYID